MELRREPADRWPFQMIGRPSLAGGRGESLSCGATAGEQQVEKQSRVDGRALLGGTWRGFTFCVCVAGSTVNSLANVSPHKQATGGRRNNRHFRAPARPRKTSTASRVAARELWRAWPPAGQMDGNAALGWRCQHKLRPVGLTGVVPLGQRVSRS